jgi:D-glycero-beta-D-manno-heptose-7-phosphate kinase
MNINFCDKKIMVIGDIMLDRYVYGDVSRISSEAPVPIVDVNRTMEVLGGAANVANNLASLGAKVLLYGIVGADQIGGTILRKLSELNVPIGTIMIDSNRPTTMKTRIIGNNCQIVRFDEEVTYKIEDKFINKLINSIKNDIGNVDNIIISDYNKGVVSSKLMYDLKNVNNFSKFIISDPHKDNFEAHKHVNLLAPNEEEAGYFCGFNIKDEDGLIFAARKIFNYIGCDSILITRGKNGMSYFADKEKFVHIPTTAKDIFDVSGAGDTVVSVLSLAIASGMGIEDAIKLSNIAAGIVVGKLGTAAINIKELNEVL